MKTYHDLNPFQKKDLLEFLTSFENPLLPTTVADMDRMYGGHAYTDGQTHWSIWREEKPVAVLGAVTEARAEKGEVYLTGICVRKEHFDLLDQLLTHALREGNAWAPCILKLGAGAFVPGLPEWAESKGFSPVYRLLEMEWFGTSGSQLADEDTHIEGNSSLRWEPLSEANASLHWEPLSEANAEMFRTACNAAFLHSPNGGVLDQEGVADLIRSNANHPLLMQLGYVERTPAVTLQLELRSGLDGVMGVIDGLAVKPGFQGRGLGRAGLLRAIGTLRTAGADRITLTVMDSNLPAVNLYQKASFRTTRVLSSWFSRSLEKPPPAVKTCNMFVE